MPALFAECRVFSRSGSPCGSVKGQVISIEPGWESSFHLPHISFDFHSYSHADKTKLSAVSCKLYVCSVSYRTRANLTLGHIADYRWQIIGEFFEVIKKFCRTIMAADIWVSRDQIKLTIFCILRVISMTTSSLLIAQSVIVVGRDIETIDWRVMIRMLHNSVSYFELIN